MQTIWGKTNCTAIVLSLCLIFFSSRPLYSQPAVHDLLYPAAGASLNGYLGERLESALQKRILAQDIDRLISPFRNRTEDHCWQTEFWGKWFTAAVLAYQYHPEPALKEKLDKAVAGLLATQLPDGYIGNYAPDKHLQQWDIWGRKYCLLGLISYYRLTHNLQSLNAARRLADGLIKEINLSGKSIVSLGNHRGMAASSVLEPMVLLYVETKDTSYLHFANKIVNDWETPDGPQLISKSSVDVSKRFPKPAAGEWFGWKQGQKAYEMMSCYEGLLELYRVTGNESYRKAVENTWASILKTEINIAGSGSAMECWFGGQALQAYPVKHYQETCVTVTWIKLCLQLFRLTGEAKYADAIEQAYYNALLGSLKPDGSDWAKYSPLSGIRLEGGQQCEMGINCCEASGPRALFALPQYIVTGDQEGLSVNFFAAGSYKLKTPTGRQVELLQQTSYPSSGEIILRIKMARPEEMSIRLRIPAWSFNTTVSINNEQVMVKPGEYSMIRREWKNNDSIHITLDIRGRLMTSGERSQYIAIMRGPLVLTRDSRLGGPDVNTPFLPFSAADGFIELTPVASDNKAIWQQYGASFTAESHTEGGPTPAVVMFCDYASAGNTFDSTAWFRVWLPVLLDPAAMH